MGDIFDLIRATVEPESRNKKTNKNKGRSIDDFLVGEEEKIYSKKEAEKQKEIKDNMLNEEIGINRKKKDLSGKIEKIDFVKLNNMKIKDQARELKRSYLDLIDVLEELSKENEELDGDLSKRSIEVHRLNKEMHKLKETIRLITGFLPDATELKQTLDSSVWKIEDVQPIIVSKIEKLVLRNKNVDTYVQQEMEKVVQENKLLKRQLVNFEAQLQKIEEKLIHTQKREPEVRYVEKEVERPFERKNEENPKKPIEQKTAKSEIEEEYKPYSSQINFDEENETVDEVETMEVGNKYGLVNLEKYEANLPEVQKFTIKIIGETGVSRNHELKPVLEANSESQAYYFKKGKFDTQVMYNAIKSIGESGFLDREQVKLGTKGGHNFTIYELSDLGKELYQFMTNKKPVVSEKKKIQDQHASVEHGYLIKDIGESFREMDYKVYTDREDLRYDLPDGKRKDFDLIIEKDGEKSHIEVERGTHNNEDFFDAMDKIYQITNEFYFVAPNENILYGKTKVQFYKWINERLGGMDQAKGKMNVHFAKFEDIKQKKKTIWETVKL